MLVTIVREEGGQVAALAMPSMPAISACLRELGLAEAAAGQALAVWTIMRPGAISAHE
ncbi:MAG: hypothetical protein JWQ16_2218 [Novosphingobium sp.]|nr:hypothetical protein [Novosphingobium sp.]